MYGISQFFRGHMLVGCGFSNFWWPHPQESPYSLRCEVLLHQETFRSLDVYLYRKKFIKIPSYVAPFLGCFFFFYPGAGWGVPNESEFGALEFALFCFSSAWQMES
jgi:hypothetical protein